MLLTPSMPCVTGCAAAAQGLTGAIHETGHALYEQGRNLEYDGLPVNEVPPRCLAATLLENLTRGGGAAAFCACPPADTGEQRTAPSKFCQLCWESGRSGGAAGACGAGARQARAPAGGFRSIPTQTAGRMQVAQRRASLAGATRRCAPRPLSGAARGAQAMSMGVHESQSLLWERMVALGRPFARYLAPKLAAAFPQLPPELTPDSLYGGRAL